VCQDTALCWWSKSESCTPTTHTKGDIVRCSKPPCPAAITNDLKTALSFEVHTALGKLFLSTLGLLCTFRVCVSGRVDPMGDNLTRLSHRAG